MSGSNVLSCDRPISVWSWESRALMLRWGQWSQVARAGKRKGETQRANQQDWK